MQTFDTFRDFWPHYVGQHRRPACRALHYLAAVVGLTLLAAGSGSGHWAVAAAAPIAGYGIAWVAHFCVERNEPATFRFAVWSLLAEFKMLSLALAGRMGGEVRRLYGSAAPAADAPLLTG